MKTYLYALQQRQRFLCINVLLVSSYMAISEHKSVLLKKAKANASAFSIGFLVGGYWLPLEEDKSGKYLLTYFYGCCSSNILILWHIRHSVCQGSVRSFQYASALSRFLQQVYLPHNSCCCCSGIREYAFVLYYTGYFISLVYFYWEMCTTYIFCLTEKKYFCVSIILKA